MTVQHKTVQFIPPANDPSLGASFESWIPDPELTKFENQEPASADWKGGSLRTIPVVEGLRHVDLPALLEHMVKHCWQRAAAGGDATRGRIALGGTAVFRDKAGAPKLGGRQYAHDLLASGGIPAETRRAQAQVAAGRHVPQVQPLVAQESAGAIGAALRGIPHLQGIATDWKTMEQLPRVSGYTFRGDTRAPGAVARAGGFDPPMTRTDAYYVDRVVKPAFKSYMLRRYGQNVSDAEFTAAYNRVAPANSAERHVLNNYFVWRVMAQNEAFHVGRMLADEALKGYISTSRAVSVARAFAKANGWVYLTRVRGGFLVPDKGTTTWTQIFGEQEIALPAKLEWGDVFGFRQLDPTENRKLTGPIYFRKGFEGHRIAFAEAYDLLSGKRQS
jgi:hypothetical protein